MTDGRLDAAENELTDGRLDAAANGLTDGRLDAAANELDIDEWKIEDDKSGLLYNLSKYSSLFFICSSFLGVPKAILIASSPSLFRLR